MYVYMYIYVYGCKDNLAHTHGISTWLDVKSHTHFIIFRSAGERRPFVGKIAFPIFHADDRFQNIQTRIKKISYKNKK